MTANLDWASLPAVDQELQDHLQQIAESLREGGASPNPSVRELLSWIGAKRRGSGIVSDVRKALNEHGLATDPDFESAFIDSPITFRLASPGTESDDTGAAEQPVGTEESDSEPYRDPTYRVSKLQAANQTPVSVSPDDDLAAAVTKMLASDYSQLPVMTSDREVKGVVSWKSIGSRLALGNEKGPVRTFMDQHVEVDATASLFTVIAQVVQHDYVLVRAADRRVCGIVTASDLSLQFQQLTEPFLLLGEIENHLRRMIGERHDLDDLCAACDPDGPAREIRSVVDLTFGEYIRLLQKPEQWQKLCLAVDRAVVVERLEKIRQIRNDVMHFDPDGIVDEDLEILRDFARFLQTLQAIRAV